MNDREKVIRAIEYCLAGCSEKCPYYDGEYCYLAPDDIENKALLRDALELLKSQEPGWISVKDRLPDEPGWYMVYAPTYRGGSSTSRENHDGIMFAKWSGKNWSVERCYYNRPGCVEKWMPLPLPEPPKEEK